MTVRIIDMLNSLNDLARRSDGATREEREELRAEQLRELEALWVRCARAESQLDRAKQLTLALLEQIESSNAHVKGGQHVASFGDFHSVPPSGRVRLRWWANVILEALGGAP